MTKPLLPLLFVLFVSLHSLAASQAVDEPKVSGASKPEPSAAQISPSQPLPAPKILWVSALGDTNDHKTGIEAMIKVKVNNYSNLLSDKSGHVILFINDIPLDSIQALTDQPSDNAFVFKLNRNQILSHFYRLGKRDLKVTVSVGKRDGTLIPGDYHNFTISFYNRIEMIFVVIGLIIITLLLIWLGIASRLLKQRGSETYSLSRTQLAFWTLIILSSYSFIVLLTADDPDLTSSSLILLGISAGTSLASTLVDERNMKEKKPQSNQPSKGFFFDILSDGEGVSIHRFQNAVFTLIFGVMYLSEAFTTLQVPSFGTNALLLMGISAAAYTTLKAQGDGSATPINPPDPESTTPKTETTT
ncbi:MAG: hypothetical protein ACFB10_20615 [Salibacteraceae bacterium]